MADEWQTGDRVAFVWLELHAQPAYSVIKLGTVLSPFHELLPFLRSPTVRFDDGETQTMVDNLMTVPQAFENCERRKKQFGENYIVHGRAPIELQPRTMTDEELAQRSKALGERLCAFKSRRPPPPNY